MQASDSDANEGIDLDDRTERALTQYLTVTPDTGDARGAPGMALVTSESGSEYLVDVRGGACPCEDMQYRDPDGGCKHIRRARFALGVDAIPATAAGQLAVDEQLGEHTSEDVQFATADGGVVTATTDADEPTDDVDDECECAELPDGVPCFDCFEGGKEWEV